MPRVSHIQYNPNLTVKQNAKNNGVSEPAIRYYIKTRKLDRRYERKQTIIADCKKYLKSHPNASRNELQRVTGHSLSTIRQYWKYISSKETLIDFDRNKIQLKKKVDERPATIHDPLKEVTILDYIPFQPYAEFKIQLNDCIQFHSKALPENKVLSNHYDCIINFRGVEFYSLEQLYHALIYSEKPVVLKEIMSASSGVKVKKLCRDKYPEAKDADYEEKKFRIIALCHLYKYLSVKEFRDRLRETYPQTLVESPNGKDYLFGMVQNLQTNFFEGSNCSGRTMMIVREYMHELETKGVQQAEELWGEPLTDEQKEDVFQVAYNAVRNQFDNSKQVIKDSKKLFNFIEREGIPAKRARVPKPMVVPIVDRTSKCLIMDFDDTLFDTSVDDIYRKGEHVDIEKAMEMIPEYRLYDGWQDVFEWVKQNHVKVGILSGASGKLIAKAMNHFNIHYDAIVGYQPYIGKPNPILGNMIMEKLNVRENQILYVGNADDDEIQARCNKMSFIGATWGKHDTVYFSKKNINTINNPREIIPLLEILTF